MSVAPDPAAGLLAISNDRTFGCILADPPWQFINRTGKMAPEHKRLSRYGTMDVAAIAALAVASNRCPAVNGKATLASAETPLRSFLYFCATKASKLRTYSRPTPRRRHCDV